MAVVLESNIDDMNPEHYDYILEKLFGAEAVGESTQSKCPTYLPKKSVESLCRGCDVDKL